MKEYFSNRFSRGVRKNKTNATNPFAATFEYNINQNEQRVNK